MLLPVPVERVWAALTDPTEIVKWFPDAAEIDLRPGGDMVLTFGTDGRCPGIVEAVEPNRRFAYWWQPGATSQGGVPEDNRTLVDFTLEPTEGGTRLRLIESGFASVPNPEAYGMNTEGWTEMLGRLETYLSKG